MRNFEALEREIRLEIREEELEGRTALSNTRMHSWQLLARAVIKNGTLNGSHHVQDAAREDHAIQLVQLLPLDMDHTLAAVRLGERLVRVQMQVEAERGMCFLLHQAIAGIERILDQKHLEHVSKLENFQRMATERLRQCAATNAMMEDRGRELTAALQEEQRLRMESDQSVKWLKQVHQHMVSVQERLLADLEAARTEATRAMEQRALADAACRDLQFQMLAHKTLERDLREEILRLERELDDLQRQKVPRSQGCVHQ